MSDLPVDCSLALNKWAQPLACFQIFMKPIQVENALNVGIMPIYDPLTDKKLSQIKTSETLKTLNGGAFIFKKVKDVH